MTTAYIYAPLSGLAISLNCYCNRRWTSNVSFCSGSCPNGNCQCSGTLCRENQNCATCASPCLCRNCCWHVSTQSGYQQPIDISGAAGTWLYAYMSAAIASVKIIHVSGICASATGDINLGTILELYTGSNATGSLIGRVFYAHLSNRQHSNGQVFNKSGAMPWFVSIGQVPSVPANQNCYLSTHVHMEAQSGIGTVSRSPSTCNGSLSAGTSVVYSWTY